MPSTTTVSIVIAVSNRTRELEECLDSIARQRHQAFELVLVLNGASQKTKAIVDRFARADSRLRTVSCRECPASAARNRGVAASSGEILYFLDDDILLPEEGLEQLLAAFDRFPEADVIGGPNLTPPGDPLFAQLAGMMLGSRLGTGISRARYARLKPKTATERDLILCNLGVRRRVFERGICFPERFFGGEENILVGTAMEAGGRVRYSPAIWVYHRRRSNLWEHMKQMVRYGWGRANALIMAPNTFHLSYFAPVLLVIYLGLLPLLVVWGPWTLLPAGIYLVAIGGASLGIVLKQRRPWLFLPLLGLFFATHVSYGAGLLATLIRRAPQSLKLRRQMRWSPTNDKS